MDGTHLDPAPITAVACTAVACSTARRLRSCRVVDLRAGEGTRTEVRVGQALDPRRGEEAYPLGLCQIDPGSHLDESLSGGIGARGPQLRLRNGERKGPRSTRGIKGRRRLVQGDWGRRWAGNSMEKGSRLKAEEELAQARRRQGSLCRRMSSDLSRVPSPSPSPASVGSCCSTRLLRLSLDCILELQFRPLQPGNRRRPSSCTGTRPPFRLRHFFRRLRGRTGVRSRSE